MSKSFKSVQQPAKWLSAHRENFFKIRLPVGAISFLTDNTDGTFTITLSTAFTTTIVEGDRVFIPLTSGYYGKYFYVETVITQNQFTVIGDFEANLTGAATIYIVRFPEVKLYAGWDVGELIIGGVDMATIQPIKQIADFSPEPDFTGFINFDVSGYLKASLPSPYKYAYSDTEDNKNIPVSNYEVLAANYTIVRMVVGRTLWATNYVANSSITTHELNQKFVDTGLAQQPLQQPAVFTDSTQDFIINIFNQRYAS